MIAAGLVAAILYYKIFEKSRTGTTSADTDLAFIFGGIGALFGAKIVYILTLLPDFAKNLPLLFSEPQVFASRYLTSGFVFYGGLYGALAGAWIYARVNKLSFYGLAQTLVPSIPLFHVFGRIGCFLEGCCYGKPAKIIPGVAFKNSAIAPNNIPLIPVQLYEASFELVLFLILAAMAKRGAGGRKMTAFYLGIYSVFRFFLEFLRGDAYRGIWGIFSTSQWISIFTCFIVVLMLFPWRRPRHSSAEMQN